MSIPPKTGAFLNLRILVVFFNFFWYIWCFPLTADTRILIVFFTFLLLFLMFRACCTCWRHLGAMLGQLGANLVPSWCHLGTILWPSWGYLASHSLCFACAACLLGLLALLACLLGLLDCLLCFLACLLIKGSAEWAVAS